MKVAIYTAATTGYHYALETQARRVLANILSCERTMSASDAIVFLVTNDSSLVAPAVGIYRSILPEGNVRVIERTELTPGKQNYKVDAQLMIAQMRTLATSAALASGADVCWSLDSDVLPPVNALRCMLSMLEFDDGYYDIAFCPYPSQGGGSFLSGRGSHHDPIFPDFYESEKDVPPELKKRRKIIEKVLRCKDFDKAVEAVTWEGPAPKSKGDLIAELSDIESKIRSLPSNCNVFEANAKGWKPRGWFDNAYPALGRGAVVPVDWTGCGCTLMSRKALILCDWTGYIGAGTEDLFINYHRWKSNGLRICSIPHCPCDHVIRHPSKPGEFIHVMTYHEQGGEHDGHLRKRSRPWYNHSPGEKGRHAETADENPDALTPEAEADNVAE